MLNSPLLSLIPTRSRVADDPLLGEAAAFLRRSATRLISVLGNFAGEDCLALGHALRDIAMDPR